MLLSFQSPEIDSRTKVAQGVTLTQFKRQSAFVSMDFNIRTYLTVKIKKIDSYCRSCFFNCYVC
jgi:hypothetical protein